MKPDNVLICLDQEDAAITRLLQEIPSAIYEPRIEPDVSPDPIITVKSQPLSNFGRQDTSNFNICLIDYSHGKRLLHGTNGFSSVSSSTATPTNKHIQRWHVQPTLLRAPEVILGHPWSTPIDIWSLGCSVGPNLLLLTD